MESNINETPVLSPCHRATVSPCHFPDEPRHLLAKDYLALIAVCLLWGGVSLVDGRTLTSHETTHCQNVREMFEDRQFLIPTYGRRPWLERPSVPHLMTGIPASIVADCRTPWAMRVGSILAGMAAVLVFAWAMAGAMGRTAGLLSGIILATMREFAAYSIGPEADIFLASVVTIAGSLFIRGEFGPDGAKPERATFFGRRPWVILLMYAVIGFTNAMKGPLFGTAFLGLAMAAYCFLGRHWGALGRYVTFWGWLAYFAVGCFWPVLSASFYPDVPEVWKSDYVKRWDSNYVGEKPWYYLIHVPWNLFPWTVPALVGLGVTARRVFRERDRVWQFIWAWALVPPVVFSLFQGKHHHYMLNCIAPWAPISLAGAIALWKWICRLPAWRQSLWFNVLVFGVPGAVVILVFAAKIPGPPWLAWVVAGGWMALVAGITHFVTRPNGRTAFIGLLALMAGVNLAAYLQRTFYFDVYEDDLIFLRELPSLVPADKPLYVLNESHVLNASWLLYYEPHPTTLLHNASYLASDNITDPAVYVLARRFEEPKLIPFGQVRALLSSSHTRAESSPMDRYTLFEITFKPDLKRHPLPPMSALQALGRDVGPELPKP
ncbi:ArnT family glycosyltransferase [Zavarzinella formosa]|uniref:ArnT family glycosyltransferase n=1 Tax=Zavarzinella formosa TaxID=360055 RepID=UPI0002DC578C|nr:hypothetical protein [Zavarzinella formosa]